MSPSAFKGDVSSPLSSAWTKREDMAEQITEEEAALYDRQLRLWGSVAQSRIRQCRLIVAPFQGGLAIETAKNLILAGIRELILVDDGLVEPESLSAGFIWREEDIGKKRVEAALSQLSALNPHVTITPKAQAPSLANLTGLLSPCMGASPIAALIYTNSNPFAPGTINTFSGLVRLNQECRMKSVRFHLAQAQGLDGFIFQDLGPAHQFIVEKRRTARDEKNAMVETTWKELQQQDFVTLEQALTPDKAKCLWKGKSSAARKRALKGSEALWATIALWNLLETKTLSGPSSLHSNPHTLVEAIETVVKQQGGPEDAMALWEALEVQDSAIEWADRFLTTTLPSSSSTQPADFAPTNAVLGGVLAQEVLNSEGGREAPKVANWMNWYGLRGQASVFALGGLSSIIPAPAEVVSTDISMS